MSIVVRKRNIYTLKKWATSKQFRTISYLQVTSVHFFYCWENLNMLSEFKKNALNKSVFQLNQICHLNVYSHCLSLKDDTKLGRFRKSLPYSATN